MGVKKGESWEAVLARTKVQGPLIMREHLKLLKDAAVGERVTREELLAAAHMVSKEATKTAFAWSSGIDREDMLLLLNVLLQAVSAFVNVCHGFTAGAGQTLLAAVRANATGVVEAVSTFLEGCIDCAQRRATKEEASSILPPLVGRVWKACEVVSKTPTTNQVAVGRGLALLAATVKDTLREMGEMEQTVFKEEAEVEGEESRSKEKQPERAASRSKTGPESTTSSRDGGNDATPQDAADRGIDQGSAEMNDEAASRLSAGIVDLHLSEEASRREPESSVMTNNQPSSGATVSRDGSTSGKTNGHAKLQAAGTLAKPPVGDGDTKETEGGMQAKRAETGGEVELPEDLGGDLGEIFDYNPEFDADEMRVVKATVRVTEGVLALLKQLLYLVAKWAPPSDWTKEAALNVLEMLHGDCSGICLQVEELGAYLYPPQELDNIQQRIRVIVEKANNLDDIVHEVVEGSAGDKCKDAIATVLQACNDLQELVEEALQDDSEASVDEGRFKVD